MFASKLIKIRNISFPSFISSSINSGRSFSRSNGNLLALEQTINRELFDFNSIKFSGLLFQNQLKHSNAANAYYKELYDSEVAAIGTSVIPCAETISLCIGNANILFLDVRPPKSFHIMHIKNFINIPLCNIAKQSNLVLSEAQKLNTKKIYVIDEDGEDSNTAVYQLMNLRGFEDYEIKVIEGGLFVWINEGGNLVINDQKVNNLVAITEAPLSTKPGEYIDTKQIDDIIKNCEIDGDLPTIVSIDPETNGIVERNYDVDRDLIAKYDFVAAAKKFKEKYLTF